LSAAKPIDIGAVSFASLNPPYGSPQHSTTRTLPLRAVTKERAVARDRDRTEPASPG